MKNFNSDDLLFALAKTDNNGEYEFYYKDERAIEEAFGAICQLIKDLQAEKDKNNAENSGNKDK